MVEKTINAKRRLLEIDTYEISGVDEAANGRSFLCFKRFDGDDKPQTETNNDSANMNHNNFKKGEPMKEEKKNTKNLIEPIDGFDEMTPEQKKAAIKVKIAEQESKLAMANQEVSLEGTQIKSTEELQSLFSKVEEKFESKSQSGTIPASASTTTTAPIEEKKEKLSEEFKSLDADSREKVLKMAIEQEKRIASLQDELNKAQVETKRLQGLMPVRDGLTKNYEEFDADKKQQLMQKMINTGIDPTKMEELLQNPRLLQDFCRTGLALSMNPVH